MFFSPSGGGATTELKRKSSLPQKVLDACHISEETTRERLPRTRKQWLKDPMLYMVITFEQPEFNCDKNPNLELCVPFTTSAHSAIYEYVQGKDD